MIPEFLFALGLANNLYLISLFLIRKRIEMKQLERFGRIYFLLGIPTVILMILVILAEMDSFYAIFLGFFLAFLFIEWLYDFHLKIDFRTNRKHLVPYLILYYIMNYGFYVMNWKQSTTAGAIILILFIIQIVVNIISHPKKEKKKDTEIIPQENH